MERTSAPNRRFSVMRGFGVVGFPLMMCIEYPGNLVTVFPYVRREMAPVVLKLTSLVVISTPSPYTDVSSVNELKNCNTLSTVQDTLQLTFRSCRGRDSLIWTQLFLIEGLLE